MSMRTMSNQATSEALYDLIRRDRRRRSRRERIGKVIGAFVSDAVVGLLTGLWLMLAIGVIHHEWIPQCPTLGYWWACVLSFLLRSALTLSSKPSKGD